MIWQVDYSKMFLHLAPLFEKEPAFKESRFRELLHQNLLIGAVCRPIDVSWVCFKKMIQKGKRKHQEQKPYGSTSLMGLWILMMFIVGSYLGEAGGLLFQEVRLQSYGPSKTLSHLVNLRLRAEHGPIVVEVFLGHLRRWPLRMSRSKVVKLMSQTRQSISPTKTLQSFPQIFLGFLFLGPSQPWAVRASSLSQEFLKR